eukprot:snap_masked-scaffold_14-processed-gene-5.18-mRNA-1 protein AED:1.00 eAED:1.00 QI:0/-1/0/0/-1/1/1/0/96
MEKENNFLGNIEDIDALILKHTKELEKLKQMEQESFEQRRKENSTHQEQEKSKPLTSLKPSSIEEKPSLPPDESNKRVFPNNCYLQKQKGKYFFIE